MRILFYILLLLAFSACKMTEQAAQKKLDKVEKQRPEMIAKFAREKNPCTILPAKTDSAQLLAFKDSLLRAIAAYNDEGFTFDTPDIPPMNADSCNEAALRAQLNKTIADCQNKLAAQQSLHNQELIRIIENTPPVVVKLPFEDSAKIKELTIKYNKEVSEISSELSKNKKWKNILIGAASLALLLILILLTLLKRW